MSKTPREIAHEKAGVKFVRMLTKWPNGFDFSVPAYRKDEFEKELIERGLVFLDIAECTAELVKRPYNLLECIKTWDFKRKGIFDKGAWEIRGCGANDLLKDDFIAGSSKDLSIDVICYAVAPTQELLDEHERTR